jgi:dTDP-4-amino-4,6-dideoxygalactose transaminase
MESRYNVRKALLTTSCTDAMEMMALLANIRPGDEVILPSYTFVSTANAFLLRGAVPVLADSLATHPCMNPAHVADLVTPKTKAIVAMHYAGVACDMDELLAIADHAGIPLFEDAAQAIEADYKGRPLGTIGAAGAFSFHETKNINSGEGGALLVNREEWVSRAEILWEKGTNRVAFYRGEVDKYRWQDLGSSFLPTEMQAALLECQFTQVDHIQETRMAKWLHYHHALQDLEGRGFLKRPFQPAYARHNAHLYYITLPDLATRQALADYGRQQGIPLLFHYVPLHESPYFQSRYGSVTLPQATQYGDTLLRLPLHHFLTAEQQDFIIDHIHRFFR